MMIPVRSNIAPHAALTQWPPPLRVLAPLVAHKSWVLVEFVKKFESQAINVSGRKNIKPFLAVRHVPG